MLVTKESVLNLREKHDIIVLFPTFKLPATTKNSFMTNQLNIIVDEFGK